ncbi:MAG: hypothetical protein RIR88_260 [Actinomycetota bacterium]|jgi:Ni/Fe-hydrogenase subunit HybB-like protein
MTRVAIIAIVLVVAFAVYALIDVIMINRLRVRGVPKGLWIVFIILFPLIGATLWFTAGRARNAQVFGRGNTGAPDDDPEFLRGLNNPPTDGSPRG